MKSLKFLVAAVAAGALCTVAVAQAANTTDAKTTTATKTTSKTTVVHHAKMRHHNAHSRKGARG